MGQTRDLGALDGPVLLFGGPVSNFHALAALDARARELDIPPQRMICTGDLVAYCADAAWTVALARALGFPLAAGNMEMQLGAGARDCGCGFAEGAACDALAARWFAHADAEIGADDRRWMAALPERLVFSHRGRRFAVVHGGARETNRFLWPVTPDEALRAEMAMLEEDLGPLGGVICGHSGIPFAREIDGRLWLNAGALGMPPNDGDPRAPCVLLDGEATIERLPYDCEAAARAMEAAGLRDGYETALRTGWWPSEDVLPPQMRRLARAC